VAIPHARSEAVLEMKIAVYLLDNELDYQSIDNLPVKIIFMIAVPENMKEVYMKVLSAISNFFRNEENRNRTMACSSADELCDVLEEIDDEI
jgi:mannitol/fructose-specific phosphotransferase system IIA component (Ntr-type)